MHAVDACLVPGGVLSKEGDHGRRRFRFLLLDASEVYQTDLMASLSLSSAPMSVVTRAGGLGGFVGGGGSSAAPAAAGGWAMIYFNYFRSLCFDPFAIDQVETKAFCR